MNETMPVMEARDNLSEVLSRVRLLRVGVVLTTRGKPTAGIVPLEVMAAIEACGGPDASAEILRSAAT